MKVNILKELVLIIIEELEKFKKQNKIKNKEQEDYEKINRNIENQKEEIESKIKKINKNVESMNAKIENTKKHINKLNDI